MNLEQLRDQVAALALTTAGTMNTVHEHLAAQMTGLSAQMTALDADLTGEMSALDADLTSEMSALDAALNGRMDALEATVANGIRYDTDAQGLTPQQKTNARTNIGLQNWTGPSTFASATGLTLSSTADFTLTLTGAAGQPKRLVLQTGGSNRWVLGSNNALETGANNGSDLVINRYSDAGVSLGAAVLVERATGATTFYAGLTAAGLTVTGSTALQSGGTTTTPAAGDNSTKIASTEFVRDALPGAYAFRNRIINGDMRIDQRRAGAALTVTPAGQFSADRWVCGRHVGGGGATLQQVADAPSPLRYSLKWTTSAGHVATANDIASIYQPVEGVNIADLRWGLVVGAADVTVSFWVKSSVAGVYPLAIQNNGGSRSYVTTYTITTPGQWERKSVTIPGDGAGVWDTATSVGLYLIFDLGTGATQTAPAANVWTAGPFRTLAGMAAPAFTTNATWNITGVQLEVGSTSSDFEHRPLAVELALCQRYYETNTDYGTAPGNGATSVLYPANNNSATNAVCCITFKVPKRTWGYSVGFWSPIAGAGGSSGGLWSVLTTGWASFTSGMTATYANTVGMTVQGSIPSQTTLCMGLVVSGGWVVDNEL